MALNQPYIVGVVDDLERYWTYRSEPLPLGLQWRYWQQYFWIRKSPPSQVLMPPQRYRRWIVYFIYAPDGRLQPWHEFALRQLRKLDAGIFIVFASNNINLVPADLHARCDALCWKGLGGFDFSAYTIGLKHIARRSPGADVLVMNDSVFGPFSDLTRFMDDARWDLTGFTGSDGAGQLHIQSYAFILKSVTAERMGGMGRVFTPNRAFNSWWSTIVCRELRLAREASKLMSVGAFWFGPFAKVKDPSLSKALALFDVGFPFLKRSLLTKHRSYGVEDDVLRLLQAHGHPL